MIIKRKITDDLYPWRIWTRLYDKSGKLLGESQSVQTYERHGNAVRVARQMYDRPFEDLRFEWIVAKTCPWPHEQVTEIRIELTHDELAEAYNHYEHHCDCEYVRNSLSQGEYEAFEDLSDKEWEHAVSEIAFKKRENQDNELLDEDVALDLAVEWYIQRFLSSKNESNPGGSCDV